MRIDYEVGLGRYQSEWVCPEHTGYARRKFEAWWRERAPAGCPMPMNAEEAVGLARANVLTPVTAITVRSVAGEKFDRITGYQFGEKAQDQPPDDWRERFVDQSPGDLNDDGSDIPF
jgi:DNA repair protein RadD